MGSLVNPLSAKVAKLRQGVKWVKMFKNNQTFDWNVSWYCWCARAGHQMSLCVEHMACCVLLVPCAPMSIVCPLSSCYPNHCFSGSTCVTSFVSLFSLLVSCSPVLIRVLCHVCMWTVHSSLPVCFSPLGWFLFIFVFILLLKTRLSLHLSPRLISPLHASWQNVVKFNIKRTKYLLSHCYYICI